MNVSFKTQEFVSVYNAPKAEVAGGEPSKRFKVIKLNFLEQLVRAIFGAFKSTHLNTFSKACEKNPNSLQTIINYSSNKLLENSEIKPTLTNLIAALEKRNLITTQTMV